MTPKFVRLIQNWSGHINTSNTWRLVLFYVKMDYSSDEGEAKNGNLVEEAYEYLCTLWVLQAYNTHIRRKAQKFVVRGGEMYFKKKKGKVCSF